MISRHNEGSEAHQGHTILPTPPNTETSVPVNSSVREKAEESTIGEASTSGHAWSGAAWHPSAPDRVCVLGSGRVSACKRFFERLYCVIGHVIGRPNPPRPGFARLFSVGRALLLAVALKLVPVLEHVEEALELQHLLVRRLGVLAAQEPA